MDDPSTLPEKNCCWTEDASLGFSAKGAKEAGFDCCHGLGRCVKAVRRPWGAMLRTL